MYYEVFLQFLKKFVIGLVPIMLIANENRMSLGIRSNRVLL